MQKLALLSLLFWLFSIWISHWFDCSWYWKNHQCYVTNGHYEFVKVNRCDNLIWYRENKQAKRVFQERIANENQSERRQELIAQMVALPYERYTYPVCKIIENPVFISK